MKKLNIFSSKRTSLNSQNGDGSPSAPTNTLGRIVNAKEVVCTLPPKSLPIPISVYVIKHACYSELWEGQGEDQHPCKLGAF